MDPKAFRQLRTISLALFTVPYTNAASCWLKNCFSFKRRRNSDGFQGKAVARSIFNCGMSTVRMWIGYPSNLRRQLGVPTEMKHLLMSRIFPQPLRKWTIFFANHLFSRSVFLSCTIFTLCQCSVLPHCPINHKCANKKSTLFFRFSPIFCKAKQYYLPTWLNSTFFDRNN